MSLTLDSLCFESYFDHSSLLYSIEHLKNKYKFISVNNLGFSIFKREIPIVTIGNGNKDILYIGAHHGMEWITSAILIKFIDDYCSYLNNNSKIFGISAKILYETRKIHIVPMLNPDGIEYSVHGVAEANVLKQRLRKMNGNNPDFSHWQANARGVDLNHNYSTGFGEYKMIEKDMGLINGAPGQYSGEYPESEPETRALCNYVRCVQPTLALTLHTQGEEIYYTSGDKTAPYALPIAQTISRLSGYKIAIPSGTAKYGGFTDWFIEEFDKPSFTIECGKGQNPLPFSNLDSIYYKLNRALFTIPILI